MPRAMYGWTWTDGTYRDGPEPRPEQPGQLQQRRQPWTRRGAFTTRPMSPRDTRNRCDDTRLWLYSLLRSGPRPATEVYRLAKLEGLSVMGVRRAKRHYGIKSLKTGGTQGGYGAKWIWRMSTAD